MHFPSISISTKLNLKQTLKLQTIEEDALRRTKITETSISPSAIYICKCTFSDCENLNKVEFSNYSKLQIIEEHYFPNVIELQDGWCRCMRNLSEIVVSPSSNRFVFKETDPNKDLFDIFLYVGKFRFQQ